MRRYGRNQKRKHQQEMERVRGVAKYLQDHLAVLSNAQAEEIYANLGILTSSVHALRGEIVGVKTALNYIGGKL